MSCSCSSFYVGWIIERLRSPCDEQPFIQRLTFALVAPHHHHDHQSVRLSAIQLLIELSACVCKPVQTNPKLSVTRPLARSGTFRCVRLIGFVF